MTAEWVTAVASAGTLVVIAATAIAAIVQLRHIRAANQLNGLLHFTDVFEGDEIQSATHFIEHDLQSKLREPDFIAGLLEINTDRRQHPELRVCDFLEQQGSYIKFGMIDKAQYSDLVGAYVSSMWNQLKDVVALRRAARNSPAMYENFEYLAAVATAHDRTHKPALSVAPLMPEPEWRRIAQQYISSAGTGSASYRQVERAYSEASSKLDQRGL